MIEQYKQGNLVWVNVRQPTHADIKKLAADFDIPPIFLNDLTSPTPRNGVSIHEGIIKVTLDFPVVKQLSLNHQHEIKCLVGTHLLITIQYEEMEAMDTFRRQFEVSAALRKKQSGLNAIHLFLSLLSMLYESTSHKLDYLETKLTEVEDGIFKHKEKQMVFEISEISRKIISFRHILFGHKDILDELHTLCRAHGYKTFESEFIDLTKQLEIIVRHARTLFDTLSALRETNSAMLTTRQNEIIKNLTIMAFITFPLTLFSSMFGMNTEHTPIIGYSFDFWIILSVMICAALGFFAFFKHRNWL